MAAITPPCLFRDTLTIEATPEGEGDEQTYRVKYGLDSRTPNRATKPLQAVRTAEGLDFRIPLRSGTTPGMSGTLLLRARHGE